MLLRYLLPLLLFLPLQPASAAFPPRSGKDFALFFAVSNYSYWDKLKNPISEAEAIAKELRDHYGFATEVVKDPTKAEIQAKIEEYRHVYADDAQLFIFFTGHGEYLENTREGFFIPKDARRDDASQDSYLSYLRLQRWIETLPCRHILLAIDACFSGTFSDEIALKGNPGHRPGQTDWPEEYIRSSLQYRSRIFMASGAKVRTPDESAFAAQFLAALRTYGGDDFLINITELWSFVQRARPKPCVIPFGGGDTANEPGADFFFIHSKIKLPENTSTTTNELDSDYDHVPDAVDLCPHEYGTAKANGCPDYDNDGIPNKMDSCLYAAGEARWQGCPDTDGDGIPDHQDLCPNQKGNPAEFGCPPADRDKDGIPDKSDACPDLAGKPSFNGCPDTDNDGVPDMNDKCPLKAGNPNMQGCPDSDGDKIPDHEDKCPNEKGELNREGCPPPDPMNLVYIKGGTFQMGGGDEADEKPQHNVSINDFYLGQYEVTQTQWRSVMGSNPPELSNKNCDNCPVEGVSWDDAQVFIRKLNLQTGRIYRLPTEAEWEYAAGNGAKHTRYSWGNSRPTLSNGGNLADETAQKSFPQKPCIQGYTDGYTATAPVGKFGPNELNLYDMTGNVWEWCSDFYGAVYYGQSPVSNPTGPVTGNDHVIRGGSWDSILNECRVSNRNFGKPDRRTNLIGFRLARTP